MVKVFSAEEARKLCGAVDEQAGKILNKIYAGIEEYAREGKTAYRAIIGRSVSINEEIRNKVVENLESAGYEVERYDGSLYFAITIKW